MNYISIISISTSLAVISATCQAFTLAETISAAKKHNFEIKSSVQKMKAVEADKSTAYTAFLPNVKAQAVFSKYEYNNNYFRESSSSDITNAATGITINQSIYNGGIDVYGVQKAEYNFSSSKEQYKSTLNNVLLNVIKTYQDVITKRNKYQLNVENVNVYSEYLKLNNARFEAGEITSTDIAQTKSRLSEAESLKESAMGEMLAAESNFEDLVGMKPPADLVIPTVNADNLPKTMDLYVQEAVKRNPVLMDVRNKSGAAAKDLNIAYGNMLPKVNGQVSFNTTDSGRSINNSGTVYSITASMPILQGGAEYTTIKKYRYLKEGAKLEVSRMESVVRASAINSWNNYNISKTVLAEKKRVIESDQKSLEGVMEEAKMGTRTTIEVLDSRKNLFQGLLSYQEAVNSNTVFCYTLYNILGDLDKVKY